jgi:hypothetical protein
VGRAGGLEIWNKAAGERVKCEGGVAWRESSSVRTEKTTRTRWMMRRAAAATRLGGYSAVR